jgi:pimeloyl-ACP methyl ester carboxylesterase
LVLVLVLVAAACSGGGSSARLESAERPDTSSTTDPGSSGGPLEWGPCPERDQRTVGLDCATLEVPLDPTSPDGELIELALARSAAEGSAGDRIGSLVLNPGGPGGSGIEFLANAAAAFPAELRERFDLVSFDPRGVGASTPVRCLDDEAKEDQLSGDLTPDTPEELQEALDEQAQLVEACTRNSGELLRHMSTADVAADLDAIREAVGDERLTYLGFSYGTSIGAVYATLHPERVRAMVLDGAVSPTPDWRQEALVQATGFERVFQRFVAECNADPRCALAPDAAGAIAAARAELETRPVTVPGPGGDRELGPDQFAYGLATALYDTSTWASAAGAVAQLRDGGAERLLTLMDRQTGRQPDGSYDNSSDAQVMVSCADSPDRPTLEESQALDAQLAAAAPSFGGLFSMAGLGCSGWPTAANRLPRLDGAGAPPILVVGTAGDPATPLEWAQQMADTLASGELLVYEGDGHTAFLTAGPCISDAVVDYLIDLTVPAAGTSCPANDAVDPFGGVRDTLVEQLATTVPRELAECVVDGMIDEVGEERFDELVLGNDQEALSRLAAAQTLRCAAGG